MILANIIIYAYKLDKKINTIKIIQKLTHKEHIIVQVVTSMQCYICS